MNIIHYKLMGHANGVKQPVIVLNAIDEQILVSWSQLPPRLRNLGNMDAWPASSMALTLNGRDNNDLPRYYVTRSGISLVNLISMALSYRSAVKGITNLRRKFMRAATTVSHNTSTVVEEGVVEFAAPFTNLVMLSPNNAVLLRQIVTAVLDKWDRATTDNPTDIDAAYAVFMKRALLAEAAVFAPPPIQFFLVWIRGLRELAIGLDTISNIDNLNTYSDTGGSLIVGVSRGFSGISNRRLDEIGIPLLPNFFSVPRKPLPDLFKEVYKMTDKQIKFVKKREARGG